MKSLENNTQKRATKISYGVQQEAFSNPNYTTSIRLAQVQESTGIARAKEHMRNAMRSKSTLDAGDTYLGLSQLKSNTTTF